MALGFYLVAGFVQSKDSKKHLIEMLFVSERHFGRQPEAGP